MLAILVAVRKWNTYLMGRHFQIKTDHYSLKFLLNQQTNTLAQQSWVVKMMGYDYELIFQKGSSNVAANTLFRQPKAQLQVVSAVTSDLIKRIQHSWITDPDMVHLLHKLQKQPDKHPKYSWQNDQLRR